MEGVKGVDVKQYDVGGGGGPFHCCGISNCAFWRRMMSEGSLFPTKPSRRGGGLKGELLQVEVRPKSVQ